MLQHFLYLLMIAGVLHGQQAASGVIAGLVVDSTGAAVRKAVVTVYWQGTPVAWATQQTDASGRFHVDSLPAGAFTISASKAGVGAGSLIDRPAVMGKLLTLANGEQRTDVVIRLIRPIVITGTVMDSGGEPLSGADVQLAIESWRRGVRELLPFGGGRTDDRGEYRISNAPPGRLYLSASALNSPMITGLPGVTPKVFSLQFYGGASEWKNATPVKVQSGQELTGMDFRLEEQRALSLRGRFSNLALDINAARGFTPPMVQVTSVEGSQARQFYGSVNIADSSFEVPSLSAGSYLLTATVKSGEKTLWATRQLDVKSDIDGVVLTLAPAVTIRGKVTVEGESAMPLTQLKVELTSPNRRIVGQGMLQATPSADGLFTFEQVPPGVWDINVRPIPKGGFIKSMRLGKQDVLLEEMEIGAKAPEALNIVVSSRGGTLTGQLAGEEGKQLRALVLLAPEEKLQHVTSLYSSTQTKPDGQFEVTGITPGKYRLFALEPVAQFDSRNPELLAKLAGDSIPVEITEGGKFTAEPKVIRAARVQEVTQQ